MSSQQLNRRTFIQKLGAGAVGIGMATALPEVLRAGVRNGMRYRTLGRTGLKVSEITLGADFINSDKANIVHEALSQGINYIDTAWGYGQGKSEEVIGQVVKSMGIRDEVYLATKASGVRKGTPEEVEAQINAKVEESLKRLQTEYIDILFCPHGARRAEHTPSEAIAAAMNKLKEAGKVRFFAVSTHRNYAETATTAIQSGFYDVVMVVLNVATLVPDLRAKTNDLLIKKEEEKAKQEGRAPKKVRLCEDMSEVLRLAKAKNVGLISMKAARKDFVLPEVHELVKARFAKDSKLSTHQICYRYILDMAEVSAVCVGMSALQHLEEALVLPGETLKG